MTRKNLYGALLSIVIFAIPLSGRADPPPGTDMNSPLAQWFQRQKDFGGRDCCGEADGHILEDEDQKIVGDHYEVRIHDHWIRVLPNQFRGNALNDPNPTGHPIIWYGNVEFGQGDVVIYCFAPGTGG